MKHNATIGIDAMAFHGPECFVDMSELAKARGVDPAKFIHGLGQRQMAVATPCEDTVTMAAVAGRRALSRFAIDPEEIGTLIVGTETGVDHSKPVAVYVHELLGLGNNCRTFETKHACYGAMAGLTSSADWIASGRARGRKALIIASDIARYGLNTAGEPTQGAGAVAMVIAENPRLVQLHSELIGDYTRQVMDFWRPLYSKYAYADGHYSIKCYLDALTGAWEDACTASGDRERLAIERMSACFYHVPFAKMAHKAHQRHVEIEWKRSIDKESETDQARLAESFQRFVAPWLELNAVVGNIYTGSLFLALIDFLRRGETKREGHDVSFFSYGSGCGASFCVGTIAEGATGYAQQLDPQAELDERRRLTIDEYETLITVSEDADANDAKIPDPSYWNLKGDLFYLGTRDHMRRYGGEFKRGISAMAEAAKANEEIKILERA